MIKDTLNEKIKHVRTHSHCTNCGTLNPELIDGDDMAKAYTVCCNELICDRLHAYTFGNDKVSVNACCWAVAEMEFKNLGIDVDRQHGMRRTSN